MRRQLKSGLCRTLTFEGLSSRVIDFEYADALAELRLTKSERVHPGPDDDVLVDTASDRFFEALLTNC